MNTIFQEKRLVTWLIGGDQEDSVETFLPDSAGHICGHQLQSLPGQVSAVSAGVMGDQVLVCGGSSGSFSSSSTHDQCYSTPAAGDGTWSRSAPLLINTSNAASAVVGDKFYVFGGYRPRSHCSVSAQVT